MDNTVKIIGGRYRGYKLQFPSALGLRPTANRIRETVFNWLMDEVAESHCLDLFTGSGALGVEALSRGARSITLIEHNKKVWLNLREQLAKFNPAQIRLIQTSAFEFLEHADKAYDLIFLDPPFGRDYITPCLNLLLRHKAIHSGSRVYLESEQAWELDDNWTTVKHKMAGHVHYGLIKLTPKEELA